MQFGRSHRFEWSSWCLRRWCSYATVCILYPRRRVHFQKKLLQQKPFRDAILCFTKSIICNQCRYSKVTDYFYHSSIFKPRSPVLYYICRRVIGHELKWSARRLCCRKRLLKYLSHRGFRGAGQVVCQAHDLNTTAAQLESESHLVHTIDIQGLQEITSAPNTSITVNTYTGPLHISVRPGTWKKVTSLRAGRGGKADIHLLRAQQLACRRASFFLIPVLKIDVATPLMTTPHPHHVTDIMAVILFLRQ